MAGSSNKSAKGNHRARVSRNQRKYSTQFAATYRNKLRRMAKQARLFNDKQAQNMLKMIAKGAAYVTAEMPKLGQRKAV